MQLVASSAWQQATTLTPWGKASSQRDHHLLQEGRLPKTTNQGLSLFLFNLVERSTTLHSAPPTGKLKQPQEVQPSANPQCHVGHLRATAACTVQGKAQVFPA